MRLGVPGGTFAVADTGGRHVLQPQTTAFPELPEDVELAPGYDFLNTTAAYRAMGRPASAIEEIALPLRGRKKKLSRRLWLEYFAGERLGLNEKTIDMVLQRFRDAMPRWRQLVEQSFLSADLRTTFTEVLDERVGRLGL